jgi:hypothetical protein
VIDRCLAVQGVDKGSYGKDSCLLLSGFMIVELVGEEFRRLRFGAGKVCA